MSDSITLSIEILLAYPAHFSLFKVIFSIKQRHDS